ncbi:MAG TPA: sigma-70 family RNA polymerase sigma factor [Candidatus Dormibacteraeota bacterium]|nr:sigma-70 family RNA polymerase sigma factor [Candidatus Dormibacteraeota bacterium]
MSDITTAAQTTHGATDAELATRARDGDADAFGQLYERYARSIHDMIYSLVRNPTLADDLTQTAFLHAFETVGRLRDPEIVQSWLYTIAHNVTRRHITRSTKAESLDDMLDLEAPDLSPEESAVSKDMIELVWTAARSLDPRQFTVLDLSIRHHLTPTEIGIVLGTSQRHASVLLHRAHDALRIAVRTLALARAREVCPRLHELVPRGQQGPLTPEQRRSVEHHMRTCTECADLATRMTAPAELLGGVLLLPLPAKLADTSWLHRAAAAAVKPSPPTGSVRGRAVRPGAWRSMGAVGLAAIAGAACIAGGVAAVTNHGSPHARAASAPAPTVSAPPPANTATAVSATAAPTASTGPQDEAGKSAEAVWADMLTTTRAAQGYRIVFATTSLSDDVTQFDVRFSRSGDYMGTVTLAIASADRFSVRKVNGVLYAQGPIIADHPDMFGMTAEQAAQLGNGWLQLTGGPRQDEATIIDRTLSVWGDPRQLADTQFTVDGTLRLAGTDTLNGEQIIVLGDDSGTVSVTRFGAFPCRASNGIDSATFSDFNAPVTVTAPAGALVLS